MKNWIEAQVRRVDYACDYVRNLVRRDRARREQEWSLERLRQKLADARDSGESGRSVEEISPRRRRSPRHTAW